MVRRILVLTVFAVAIAESGAAAAPDTRAFLPAGGTAKADGEAGPPIPAEAEAVEPRWFCCVLSAS